MMRTPVCEVLGIEHPVVLGGMPTLFDSAELVAAVSGGGGLGCTHLSAEMIHDRAAAGPGGRRPRRRARSRLGAKRGRTDSGVADDDILPCTDLESP